MRGIESLIFKLFGAHSPISRIFDELKSAEVWRRAVSGSAAHAVVSLDPEGMIVAFNSTASRIFGYSADEMVGKESVLLLFDRRELNSRAKTLSAELGAEVETGFNTLIARSSRGLPDDQEWHCVRRDGSLVGVRVSMVAMIDDDGHSLGYVALATEVSAPKETKEAESSLLESEERFRLLSEHSRDMICLHDAQGNYTYVSPAVTKILGWSSEELIGRSPYEFIHPDDQTRLLSEAEAAANEDDDGKLVCRMRSRDGNYVWVETLTQAIINQDGQVARLQSTSRDITETKVAALSLERERTQLRRLIANAPVSMAMLDRELRFVTFSKRFLSDYGIEAPGARKFTDVFPEMASHWNEHLERCLEGETLSVPEECLVRGDGSQVHLRRVMQPWYSEDGIGGVLFVSEQIDELVHARESAIENARLKSEFIANMSHEIRTPINGVIGLTELLLESEIQGEQREYAETIRYSAETLLSLVNDILDFSKVEAGKMILDHAPFDLGQLLHDLKRVHAYAAQRKGIDLNLNCPAAEEVFVRGDAGRISQILTNLIGNAVKFTENGKVTISVRREGASASAGGSRFYFEVRDTGIGISDLSRDRLFSPFYQGDSSNTRKYGGTGLGLSICKKLVELMAGQIGVESTKGKGSVFWFSIDLEDASRVERAPETDRVSSAVVDPRAIRILVAEDNPVNCKVVTTVLRKDGYTVETVENGRLALEAVALAPYQLILMDIQMPEMDGIEATHAIRALEESLGRSCPIVALTAGAVADNRDRCFQAGMDDYLLKPFTVDDLRSIVSKWVGGIQDGTGEVAHTANSAASNAASNGGVLSSGFDPEFLRELVDIFLKITPERLERISEASACGDLKKVAFEAHSLKSSAANLGAKKMSEICLKLEKLGRAGDPTGVEGLVDHLRREYQTVKLELDQAKAS